MVEIVEVKHTPISEGKEQVRKVLLNDQITVPRSSAPQVLEGRWRQLRVGERKLEPEVEKMVKAALDAISENVKITTQRNIYYTIRGTHPDWKFNGMDLNEDKVYNALTGTIMEDVQLATDRTMQSLGVWAAPRGYITGDGYIYSERRGRVPLTAMPAIQFDLCDEGVTVSSRARKIIHFEKDAGFEGIAGHDNAVMLETQYSTSQGYPVESANKYLADCQKRGLKVYVVHDADPHGIQMQLMYGMASKNNAYMPSNFYPLPQSVILLGLFPRVALGLDLPAEKVGETHKAIIPNLLKIVEENPMMKEEVQVIVEQSKQWEFQALNGLSPNAPPIYLVEALRVKGDEIKHVPEDVKKTIMEDVKVDIESYVEDEINTFVEDWFRRNLRETMITRLKELLAAKMEHFKSMAEEEFAKVSEEVSTEEFREAVKLKLVKDPKQYWDDAARQIAREIVDEKFEIVAEPQVTLTLETADAVEEITVAEPEIPEQPLNKDDIVASVEKKMVGRAEQRDKLVAKIRETLEKIFGKPDLRW